MRDPADPTARIRHARIELPDEDYMRLKRAARAIGLGVAGYIRMSVLERVAEDGKRIANHTPPNSASRSDHSLMLSAGTSAGSPFATGLETERILEQVRLV